MKSILTLAVALFLFTSALSAQTFSTDSLFGHNGLAVLDHGSAAPGRATMVSVAADGKILLGGYSLAGLSEPFTLSRFLPDGTEDLAFGQNGVVQHAKFEGALKLAPLPDGKILVLLPRGFQVARLLADGSEDHTFHTAALPGDEDRNTYCTDLLLQPDGKILVSAFGTTGVFKYACVARFLPDGALDTGFGIGGMARYNVFGAGYAEALALDADGRILVGNSEAYDKLSVIRYLPNGSPDPGFGANGIAIWPQSLGDAVFPRSMSVQPDGKILVGAEVSHSPQDYVAVYRLQSDGSPDTGFGNEGISASPSLSKMYGLCLQSDGQILLGGLIEDLDAYTGILRFKANGELDADYKGTNSCSDWIANNDGEPMGFTLQADGKLLAAIPTRSYFAPTDGFIAVRLLESGEKDPDFGFGGVAYTGYDAGDDMAADLALQPDGKTLLIGDTYHQYLKAKTLLARFNADGTPDLSFGNQGKVEIVLSAPNSNYAYGVAVQPDGKILAAVGFSYSNIELKILRFNADGTPDTGFGINGVAAVPGNFFRVADLLLQPDGKILVGATLSDRKFAAVRLLPNGSPDNTFGSGGTAALAPVNNATVATCSGISLLTDGKILLGGMVGFSDPAVVRFKANGQPDPTFSGDGRATFPVGSAFYVYSTALQSDGKILLGGSDFRMIRILADGSGLDPAFGSSGVLEPGVGSYCRSIVPLSDGHILGIGTNVTTTATMFEVLRLNADGSIPAGGIFISDPGGYGFTDVSEAVLAGNGKVVVAGGVRQATDIDMALMRYFTGSLNGVSDLPVSTMNALASPNPFSTHFKCRLQDLPAPAERISVFNAAGQQVYLSEEVSNTEKEIWLGDSLQPGVYLLRVETSLGVFLQKLVSLVE